MIDVATRCRSLEYETRANANDAKRAVERTLHVATRPVYCAEHDAYHIEAVIADPRRKQLSATEREILRKTALGLRYREIAIDLDMTYETVRRRVEEMMRRLGAISVPNLIATAVWLRVIDITDLMPKEIPHGNDGTEPSEPDPPRRKSRKSRDGRADGT